MTLQDALSSFISDKNIFGSLFNLIRIGLSTLGVVYILGRMLSILRTDKSKNRLGIIMMLLNSAGMVFLESKYFGPFAYFLWACYLYFTIVIVFYVWFLWRSFDRVDSFLDRKGWKDRGKRGKK